MREGTTLGAYRLLSELGSGGMGTVHLAQVEGDVAGLRIGDRVALKVIHPHLVTEFEMLGRFIQEVELGKRIRHENVVRTLDAGIDVQPGGESVYLVMEHVPGSTLGALLAEQGPLPEGICRRVARAAARGLAGIHEQGVVHADLKPENLLVTRDEVVKIMDLGLAHIRGHALAVRDASSFTGTLIYAAPEQFGQDPENVDARADLYALGVTLYELAGGTNPFRHDDFRVVVQRQLETTPPPLCEVAPDVSPFVSAVVEHLLHKDPAARFRSASELFSVLARAEDSRWWRRRSVPSRNARALSQLQVPCTCALHGRTPEIVALRDALADARTGRLRVVLVTGERGIGKTRLLDGFVRALDLLGDEVDVHAGPPPPDEGSAASVAIFEDLSDAPPEVRAEFEALARGRADRPLLVLGTASQALERTWRAELLGLPHASEIVLHRLRREAFTALIEDALDTGGAAAALLDDLHDVSGGHPLVALAYVAALRSRDALRRGAGRRWETAEPVASLPLPDEVVALHRARLAGLDGEDRDLLDVAACLGERLDADLLGELTGESATAVLRRMTRLTSRHRVLDRAGEGFVFHSPTFRRHVYGEMPDMLREEYHRLIGETLQARAATASDVCRHLLLGGLPGDAAPHLEAALAALAAESRHAELLDVAERALATAQLRPEQRLRVGLRHALALARLGRTDDCAAAMQKLLEPPPQDGGKPL